MTDIKTELCVVDGEEIWLPVVPQRACDECGAKLFPGDWLTRDGCCWCEAGLDILMPWGDR